MNQNLKPFSEIRNEVIHCEIIVFGKVENSPPLASIYPTETSQKSCLTTHFSFEFQPSSLSTDFFPPKVCRVLSWLKIGTSQVCVKI